MTLAYVRSLLFVEDRSYPTKVVMLWDVSTLCTLEESLKLGSSFNLSQTIGKKTPFVEDVPSQFQLHLWLRDEGLHPKSYFLVGG